MVPLSMTLSDLWPGFQGHDIVEVEYRKKDKVTVVEEEKYLTYGMVLCLVTLTDLKIRRAGLSASAELVFVYCW